MYVVTGASGFLGRAVVAELVARDLPVLAVSRGHAAFDKAIQTLQVNEYSKLKPIGHEAVLLHLAEPSHIGAAELEGTAHGAAMRETVSALAAGGWAHVVYASSGAVYGDDSNAPHQASEPVHPRGAYAQSKVACEAIVLASGGGAARLANLYGRGMARNNVMSDILGQLGGQGPVRVRDATPVRDYLWIEDAARGLVDAATAKLPGVFNLATGIGTSVATLAEMILSLANEDRPVEQTALSGRRSYLVLDIAATTERLGWRPSTDLRQGLSRLLGVTE